MIKFHSKSRIVQNSDTNIEPGCSNRAQKSCFLEGRQGKKSTDSKNVRSSVRPFAHGEPLDTSTFWRKKWVRYLAASQSGTCVPATILIDNM
jgi:hypothetical protein